jgi:hypothetical protein
LATTVVQNLDASDQRAAAEAIVHTLPTPTQEQVAESILGPLDVGARTRIWYLVISFLGLSILVFGVLAFVLMYQDKNAEGPLALATTALGAVAGLLSQSRVWRGVRVVPGSGAAWGRCCTTSALIPAA